MSSDLKSEFCHWQQPVKHCSLYKFGGVYTLLMVNVFQKLWWNFISYTFKAECVKEVNWKWVTPLAITSACVFRLHAVRSQASIVSPASFSSIIHASFQELFSISWAKQSESVAKQVLVVAVVPPLAVDADEGAGKSMPGEDAGKSELDEELAARMCSNPTSYHSLTDSKYCPWAKYQPTTSYQRVFTWATLPSGRNCILPPPKAKDPAQPHPVPFPIIQFCHLSQVSYSLWCGMGGVYIRCISISMLATEYMYSNAVWGACIPYWVTADLHSHSIQYIHL